MISARAVLAAASTIALVACGWVIGLEQPVAIERPPDASPGPDVAPAGCAHATPPARNGDDDPTREVPAFWLAFDVLRYDHVVDGGIAGFDLDESCTCADDERGGAAPCVTAVPGGRVCDADGGIDNELGATLAGFGPAFDVSGYVGKEIARGRRSLLLWIKGYNGLANDADVTVALVLADGLYTNLGCDGRARGEAKDGGCPPDGDDGRCFDGGVFPPTWDGCDRWHPRDGAATFGAGRTNAVALHSDRGYVVDHQLVVEHSGALDVFGPGRVIPVRGAVTVARLAPRLGGGAFDVVDGRIAGRAPLIEIARAIGGVETGGLSGGARAPFCQSPFWGGVKDSVCRSADMMRAEELDRTGARCDAFGFALGFTARLAEVDDRAVTPLVDVAPAACAIPDSVERFCAEADADAP